VGVVRRVSSAGDDDDAGVQEQLVEGGCRLGEDRLARPAEDLEDRLLDRSVVWTAAARRGQIGSARYAARSASGMPTISRKNVSSAASRSSASMSSRIRSSMPDGR
jgi:hypothetical protein